MYSTVPSNFAGVLLTTDACEISGSASVYLRVFRVSVVELLRRFARDRRPENRVISLGVQELALGASPD